MSVFNRNFSCSWGWGADPRRTEILNKNKAVFFSILELLKSGYNEQWNLMEEESSHHITEISMNNIWRRWSLDHSYSMALEDEQDRQEVVTHHKLSRYLSWSHCLITWKAWRWDMYLRNWMLADFIDLLWYSQRGKIPMKKWDAPFPPSPLCGLCLCVCLLNLGISYRDY